MEFDNLHTALVRTTLKDGHVIEFTYRIHNAHPDKVRSLAFDAAANDNPDYFEIAISTITRIWKSYREYANSALPIAAL